MLALNYLPDSVCFAIFFVFIKSFTYGRIIIAFKRGWFLLNSVTQAGIFK